MAQSTHKVVHPESTYDVIELIGTSTKSWEDAAKNAVEEAGGKHLRELRKPKSWKRTWLSATAKSMPIARKSNSPSNMNAMVEPSF
jgi:flavin-binding protein dodecin